MSTAQATDMTARHRRACKLDRLRLPRNLLKMLREGTIVAEYEAALTEHRLLVKLVDEWEAANPEAAKIVSWRAARDEWIAKGRPDPEWYELLWMVQTKRPAVSAREIEHRLLPTYNVAKRRWWLKKRAKMNKRKRRPSCKVK